MAQPFNETAGNEASYEFTDEGKRGKQGLVEGVEMRVAFGIELAEGMNETLTRAGAVSVKAASVLFFGGFQKQEKDERVK